MLGGDLSGRITKGENGREPEAAQSYQEAKKRVPGHTKRGTQSKKQKDMSGTPGKGGEKEKGLGPPLLYVPGGRRGDWG